MYTLYGIKSVNIRMRICVLYCTVIVLFCCTGYDGMKKSSLYQDGEESDTGTDILVNTKLQDISPRLSPSTPEPLHRRTGSHQYGYRRRRDSLGSEGSLSEEEMEKPAFSKHPRSKSADGRGGWIFSKIRTYIYKRKRKIFWRASEHKLNLEYKILIKVRVGIHY